MHPAPRRHFHQGHAYTVQLCPAARSLSRHLSLTVVFTREADGAILSAPVGAGMDLHYPTGGDLDELLQRAR